MPNRKPNQHQQRRRRNWGRQLGDRVLLLLIALAYWPNFLLVLLGYALRYLCLLPLLAVAVVLATLEWLQMWLAIAKINVQYRDDESTRQAALDELYELIDEAQRTADV